MIFCGEIADFRWAGGFSLALVPVLLEAGGKPSTWFPPGGLVEHRQKIKKT